MNRHPIWLLLFVGLIICFFSSLMLISCKISNHRDDGSMQQLHQLFTEIDDELISRGDLSCGDAATFAWRESPIIDSYITMYLVTGDISYMTKAYDLLQPIFEKLQPWGEFLAWTTDKYSVATAQTSASLGNKGSARIVPSEARIIDPSIAVQVTGHMYRVVFRSEGLYDLYIDKNGGWQFVTSGNCPESIGQTVSESLTREHEWVHQMSNPGNNYWSVKTTLPLLCDPQSIRVRKDGVEIPFGVRGENSWSLRDDDGRLNIWLPLEQLPWAYQYTIDYTVACNISAIPGVFVQIVGQPEVGDEFIISTASIRPLPHLVLEGVILQPALRFIKMVLKDNILEEHYGAQARQWLNLIETKIVPKWEPCQEKQGYYLTPKDPAYRYPGEPLPFNQFLAFGRSLFLLYDITGNVNYLSKAAQMARYFKNQLSLTPQGAYVWYYSPTVTRFDDTSHANLVIAFVVDAFNRGIIFEQSDMERFAKTFLNLMWNGSMESSEVGTYINGPAVLESGRNFRVQEWVLLATLDERVWEVCKSLLPKQKPEDANLKLQLIANLLWLQKETPKS